MSPLTQQQIDAVAAKVVQYLHTDVKPVERPKPTVIKDNKAVDSGAGIFSNVDEAVQAARIAFNNLNSLTLEKRNDIINNIRKLMLEYAEDLAKNSNGSFRNQQS